MYKLFLHNLFKMLPVVLNKTLIGQLVECFDVEENLFMIGTVSINLHIVGQKVLGLPNGRIRILFDFENPDKEGKDPNCEQLRKMLTTKSEEKRGHHIIPIGLLNFVRIQIWMMRPIASYSCCKHFHFSWLRGRIDNLRGVYWVFSRSILLISGRIWHGVIFSWIFLYMASKSIRIARVHIESVMELSTCPL